MGDPTCIECDGPSSSEWVCQDCGDQCCEACACFHDCGDRTDDRQLTRATTKRKQGLWSSGGNNDQRNAQRKAAKRVRRARRREDRAHEASAMDEAATAQGPACFDSDPTDKETP